MSIKDYLTKELTKRGLWPEEAASVVEKVEQGNDAMVGRWNDDTNEYPKELLAVLAIDAYDTARNWLTENKPRHFALTMFSHHPASGGEG